MSQERRNEHILCLDVGNTQVYAGLYTPRGELTLRFRRTSGGQASADEYGVFLRGVLRENGIDPEKVRGIAMASVVPQGVYSLRRACQKYFDVEPFILQAGVKTGLQIAYRNPLEVGADRIANAIALSRLYPGRNGIVADFGTATTLDVVSGDKRYLGGAIAPGLRVSMEVLEQKTARLPSVEILRPDAVCGKSTVESIQAGLYYGQLGMVRELVERIRGEVFDPTAEPPIILATGGFSHLFAGEGFFDAIEPDLVLAGLFAAWQLNQG
ncbi:type III pantothenate kinase [Spirochaeta lutea]|uniref:Type III pantothenate kinase n=1 Tax=Spirochaeta lutea TaxID=1480694 RepID=A0A098R0W9_9SPIO|nr:type III pantothenate kinase [Spirochaeta lutea]KGE73406.1 pantothenate kinase [Spirochaeta lutea]